VGDALARLGHSLVRVKNLGTQHTLEAEIWSSEIVHLGVYEFTALSPWLVDQSSPNFFHPTREESGYKMYLSNFEYLHPFRRYLPPNFKVVRNRAKFCMFLALNWVGPRNAGQHYKIRPSTYHRAKFRAYRKTHLGDLTLTKKIKNK